MRSNIIGIDIGGTAIKAGLVDEKGKIYHQVISVLQREEKSEEGILNKLKILIKDELLKESSKMHRRCLGIGIGVAGIIDIYKKVITTSPNFPQWKDFYFIQRLEAELKIPLPLYFDNDANVIALGEKRFGKARKIESFVLLTLGTGVGGAIILNEKIWRGENGMAAELGHITVYPEGYKCNCGNRGCLEQYTSSHGLRYLAQENEGFKPYLNSPHLPKRIYEAAKAGDIIARQYFRRMGKVLGIGLASILNILNIKHIILAGGISKAFEYIVPEAIAEIKARAFPGISRGVKIIPSSLGDKAGILGGVALVLDQFRSA
jgi:glucokinase